MSDASSSAEYDAFLTHDWGDDELGRSNHARVAEVNRLLKAADQKEFAQALEFFEVVEELLQAQQKDPATWHGGNLQRYLGETRKALELERKGFKTPESPNAQKIAEFLKKVSIDGLEVDEPVTSPLRNSDANKYGQLLHEPSGTRTKSSTSPSTRWILSPRTRTCLRRIANCCSAARRRQSVRATVHAVSAVNYLSAAARRTKLLALAAKLRSWRRATRLALAVIVALAALVAALYSPLQAYV